MVLWFLVVVSNVLTWADEHCGEALVHHFNYTLAMLHGVEVPDVVHKRWKYSGLNLG
jgi:hypothetical protein